MPMKAFLQKFSSIISESGGSLDQIVHLGAGQHAEPSDYSGLRYRRLVLVEGDPESVEVLSAACEEDPSVQVIQKIITPSGGDVRFHRFNLSSVNGVLPAGTLTSLYPRLRVLGHERLPSSSLGSLLEELEIDAQKRNLLILDIPGLEASLIESLTKEQLRKFEFILIRGCRESLQVGAISLKEMLALLKKSHYTVLEQDEEEDPHWPIVLLKIDGAHAELEEELENRARLLVEKATEIYQQGERIAELERVVGETNAQRDGLQGGVTELTRQLGETRSAQFSKQEELESRDRLLVEKATEIHQHGERITELERVVGEVSAQRDGLQGELVVVRAAMELSNQQLGTHQTRISDLESEVSSKETLLDVLSKGRVQQDRVYEELSEERDGLLKQIETLEARLRDLELQIQERDGKSQLVDAEFQKVEGQMEIIKEIFLKERLK
jgi:peptidoglycan hydrolase CwlO-like protein